MKLKQEQHKAILDLSVIDSFKFCPFCSEETLEVFVGDFTGYVMCDNNCEELKFDYTLDK